MSEPVVNGLKAELGDKLELIHLNLLSGPGREAAGAYGVMLVPTTLLFDGQGELLLRQMGLPERTKLRQAIEK